MFPFSSTSFIPETDIPDLTGKVIIITGANSGLGYESLIHLARHSPSKIYLCARSQAKYENALKGILAAVPEASEFIGYLELDLASLSSVKKAAEMFIAQEDRLDLLMNNAGIMAQPAGSTTNGFEIQFGTNHMGHALLTKTLLPILQKTAASTPNSDVRIINISSDLHRLAPKPHGFLPEACLTDMTTFSTWTRYGQSKLANILFTTELARRYGPAGITSVAIHPGGVATNLMDQMIKDHPYVTTLLWPFWKLFATPADRGAWNQTWAATAPVVGKPWTKAENESLIKGERISSGMTEVANGSYYMPVMKEGGATNLARDSELAVRLWEWTQEQLRQRGY